MPTQKEILQGLLNETEQLHSSLGDNTEASDALRQELDQLQGDIASATRELAMTTERTVQALSDRVSDLRGEIAEAFRQGAHEVGHSIKQGFVEGSIVGQVVANVLQQRANDPVEVMGRRINDALYIINTAFQSGERNDYAATLYLLRVHDFKAEQSRYIIDKLIKHGVLTEFKDTEGKPYLMIDPENSTWKQIAQHYVDGYAVYLA